ncbi:MAG: YccF domain-containing protein [Candidatus Riflebacteria bacterium]|nr:YccF domain-containing protein [Candidatus Riflebacteria bacterium]
MNSCLFLILRIIWFVCIGLPVGWFCIHIGWLLMLTIIGIPFTIWIYNRIPMIMTLQMDVEDRYKLKLRENEVFQGIDEQYSMLIRIPYFILIGWWFSLLWINIAYFFSASIIGVPIGFWMFNRLPLVIFLTQS